MNTVVNIAPRGLYFHGKVIGMLVVFLGYKILILVFFRVFCTLDQSRGRKTDGGTRRSQKEGRRRRLWSPWTSLSGTAPIRINIQNLDVGFHWFISDRSREITHSLLCKLLSGRSPTNQSTQV